MSLRILFLDDDDIQNDIMQEYLSFCDVPHEAVFIRDGFTTLQYLTSMDDEALPDVLFIDVFMPLMDGWEALNRLGSLMEKRDWDPSIYILTSSVSNKDREMAAQQKNMKAFMNKPIKFAELNRILKDEFDALSVADR